MDVKGAMLYFESGRSKNYNQMTFLLSLSQTITFWKMKQRGHIYYA